MVTPFWLDRPDTEALDIAVEADRNGFGALWIGEMVTFDAFALATAVGARTGSIALRIGPLAATVRGPVALAALRGIFDGERAPFEGRYVRTRGFRLRSPRPGTRIGIAAFGPAMTRVAAEEGDELVLNLVTAEYVSRVREIVDAHARDAGRPPPRIAVWLPIAHNPGARTLRQIAGQLAVYLRPPGYGEMFGRLGHGALVERARAGAPRAELAAAIPPELVAAAGAVGSMSRIAARIGEYRRAGADHVAVVPATAEDPSGGNALAELAKEIRA